jgi:hypothetical protein
MPGRSARPASATPAGFASAPFRKSLECECAGWAFWGRRGVAAHAVQHLQDAGSFPGRPDGGIAPRDFRNGALAAVAGSLARGSPEGGAAVVTADGHGRRPAAPPHQHVRRRPRGSAGSQIDGNGKHGGMRVQWCCDGHGRREALVTFAVENEPDRENQDRRLDGDDDSQPAHETIVAMSWPPA